MHDVRPDLGKAGQVLWDYWHTLPRPGLVPDRGSFDPMAIPRLLSVVSLMQCRGPHEWLLRAVGSEITSHAGRDVTWRNYLDLIDAPDRLLVARQLAALIRQPCASVSVRAIQTPGDLGFCARIVSLPLRADDGTVSLLISSTERIGTPRLGEPGSLLAVKAGERQYLDLGAGVPGALPELPPE